jgi:serine/threonine-protein kinase
MNGEVAMNPPSGPLSASDATAPDKSPKDRDAGPARVDPAEDAVSNPAATADLARPQTDELAALAASIAPPTHGPPAHGGATVDYLRPATEELAGLTASLAGPGTVERQPAQPTGFADSHEAQTVDQPTKKQTDLDPEARAREKRRAVEQLPQSVAGYDVLGLLGRGAMGVVYKARQRGLKRLVALKMILAGGHAAEHELARFRIEAEAVAQLQHPNIVQIYEVGEEEGRPFFSLEFVEGTSLDKKIQGTPVPPREAALLGQQLAEAMDYAHKNGIIHRDLKPANILLTADGTPKIGDFGLAKKLEEDAGQTRTGTVLGTPSYMSPEQAEGKIAEVGPLSDVYSLGAILYDLLTGRAPFKGTTILETLEQVRTREPVPPVQLQPGVPRDLETICLKCLQKDPERRYSSAGALAEDLGRFLKGEPILARPVGRVERLWRWCKRNPWMAGLGATVVVAVIAWGITASLMAWQINLQKDEIHVKKDEAERQTKEAEKQTVIAQKTEESSKATADAAVSQMVKLGKMLDERLRSRRLAQLAGPEVVRLRAEILATLRQALINVSAKIDLAGGTPFGPVGTYQALGDLLLKLGQSQEALRAFQQGHQIVKKLADERPNSDLTRANLAVMVLRLGKVPFEQGDARTALKYYLQARDIHWDVLTHPRDGYYKEAREVKQIVSHDDIPVGEAYLALGMAAEAKKHFAEALTYRAGWLKGETKPGEVTSGRSYVMQAHLCLGMACARLGDAKGAEEHFGEALKLGEALQLPEDFAKKSPLAAAEFRDDLARTQGAYGDALIRLGEAEEADKVYRSSLQNMERAIAFDDLSRQDLLALTHERLAAAARARGQKADAARHSEEALKLREELYRADSGNPVHKAAFVLAMARSGKHAPADFYAGKLRPEMSKSPELLLQLARCWSVCASQDSPQKAQYLDRALQALQAATKDDYKDAVALQTDPDLAALRTEPRFQAVIDRVKAR